MHRIKRFLWMLLGCTAALVAAPDLSHADEWPQRAVRVIVPLGAGSSPDIVARIYAERLSERWKQPVIVENRPGGDGLIGVSSFVNMHDDHALLFSISGPITTLPLISEKPPYEPSRDLVSIGSAADSFVAVAVTSSLKVGSLPQLLDHVRAHAGALNYNASAGALPYLAAAFLKRAGLNMVLVPYRDTNRAVSDLAEGRLQAMVSSVAILRPLVAAGKVNILAVTNSMRASVAPSVPTTTEAGYPDLTYEGLFGFFGPQSMPSERRDRIAAELRAIAAEPAVSERLAAMGLVAHARPPAEFAAALADERAKMSESLTLLSGKLTD
jgi:tripartite-type tricarboxylate transporter receptor subunit TctC